MANEQRFSLGDENMVDIDWLAQALLNALTPLFMLAEDSVSTDGLSWAYKAALYRNADNSLATIAAGSLMLTAGTTDSPQNNYVEIDPTTHVVSSNTTAFTSGRLQCYILACDENKIVTRTPKLTYLGAGGGEASTLGGHNAAYFLARANHTGSQTASTISDFTAAAKAAIGTTFVIQGSWNANTNSPSLSDGAGTNGDFYTVSADGSTTLGGNSVWKNGDAVYRAGGAWHKIDGLTLSLAANSADDTVIGSRTINPTTAMGGTPNVGLLTVLFGRVTNAIAAIIGSDWFSAPATTLAACAAHIAATIVHGATGAVMGTTNTQTVTNKRVTKRSGTVASSATPTINTDNFDFFSITALAAAITSMTSGLSGTPVEADELRIAFTDNGTARAISWGSSFEDSATPLPTTTVISQRLDVLLRWNTVTSKWRCIDVTMAGGGGSGAWGGITGALSDQTDLQSALDAKAPLVSPTLGGTPLITTTPSPGDNSHKISDTAFVAAAIAAIGDADTSARVYNSSNISLTNNTATALTFDTVTYDSDSLYDAMHASRLTAPGTGKYSIVATVDFDAQAVPAGVLTVALRVNGSTIIAKQSATPAVANEMQVTVATQYELSATDYVEVIAFQNSGGALNVLNSGIDSPAFAMALNGAGSAAIWGEITGTLASQADLATALDSGPGIAGADVASASTITPGVDGDYINITGTTGITTIDTTGRVNGQKFYLRFTGALTLTHDGTKLQLFNSTNYTTVAGDQLEFVVIGANEVRQVVLANNGGTGGSSTGNYFGTGADGALHYTTDTVLTSESGNDDDSITVLNAASLILDSGKTLSFSKRIQGAVIYVQGDAQIDGIIDMSSRGAAATPISATEISRILGSIFPHEGGAQLFSCPLAGAAGGASQSTGHATVGNAGSAGTGGQTGGGAGGGGGSGGGSNYGSGGSGSAGTAFCGGSGGGGGGYQSVGTNGGNASSNGGAGGVGANSTSNESAGGGGAGNPGGAAGGTNGSTAGGNGGGGFLALVIGGNLSGSGTVKSNGDAGGHSDNVAGGFGCGGGGSGGGSIVILYAGASTWAGTIQANGGVGGVGGPGDGANGGAGGNGSIQGPTLIAAA